MALGISFKRLRKCWQLKLIMVVITLLFSCKKENLCDCLKGTGDDIIEYRELAPFKEILIDDEINLFIIPNSDEYGVEIEAGEKIVDLIKTEVKDSMLYITNDNRCNWVRSLKREINMYLKVKELVNLEVEGSASVFFKDTLFADKFACRVRKASGSVKLLINCNEAYIGSHSGVCDITAAGKARVAFIPHTANAPCDCRDLVCNLIYGRNESKCDTWVNAVSLLSMQVQYVGNVYYYGSPKEVNSIITGEGNLIKAE